MKKNIVEKCMGCGKPSRTLYCDRCVPPFRGHEASPVSSFAIGLNAESSYLIVNSNRRIERKKVSDED